jgi:hypothetical protein
MWPFNRKDNEQEEAMIWKAFSKHIDERLIAVLLENPEGLRMSEKQINFVMVLADEASDPVSTIREIVTLVQKHEGMVASIEGTLVTVYFGVPLPQPNQKEQRLKFVIDLSEKVRPRVAVVHGECECQVGKVGNEQRMGYTAFIPDFKGKLGKLCSLEIGQIIGV